MFTLWNTQPSQDTMVISPEAPRSDFNDLSDKKLFPYLTYARRNSLWIGMAVVASTVFTIYFFVRYLFGNGLSADNDLFALFFLLMFFLPIIGFYIYLMFLAKKTFIVWKDVLTYGTPIMGKVYGYYSTNTYSLLAPFPDSGMVLPLSMVGGGRYRVVIEFIDDANNRCYHTSLVSRSDYHHRQRLFPAGSNIPGLAYNGSYLFAYDTKPHFMFSEQ